MTRLLLALLLGFFPTLALADMADVRPMPRPELVTFTFVEGENSVVISLHTHGDGEGLEVFNGVSREVRMYTTTADEFAAGGEFDWIVSYYDEGGEAGFETAVTYYDEAGVLTLSLLGAVPMKLLSEERISTLNTSP